jgi:hypothetical protein
MANSGPSSAPTTGVRYDAELVRSELTRLQRSDQFKNSKRCQTLLTYIVEETLADHGEQLKERLLGVNVFGRKPDYDTGEDPVVRNAAIEVRKRLAQFYIESGQNAPVRIDLHPGTYVPEFRYPKESPSIPEPEQLPHVERPRRASWIAIGTVSLLVLGVAGAMVYRQLRGSGAHESQPNDAAVTRITGAAASLGISGTAAGDGAVRILAGNQQPGPYVDRFGDQWLPDGYFSGGEARPGVTHFFFPPADPVLFRTVREGSFTYDIPLKQNLTYELRLYFVEPQYRYGNRVAGDGENSRLFQVRANGKVILENFDIIEDAGFASTTVRAFKEITPASDGKLHLQFVAEREQPIVSAVELLPTSGHSIPPVRIRMGPSQYTDQSGKTWSPDNFYIGGQLFDSGAAVTDTPDPDLFDVGRVGNFSYAIPLPPGRYRLTLYFAETWFHHAGQRVFDVSCNGILLFHDLDVFQQAGFSHVYQKSFHGLEPNGQGKLLISFSPKINYAELRTLEVAEE